MRILVYDGVEELDFVGPLEVFGSAKRVESEVMQPKIVAESKRKIECANGLIVTPSYAFQDITKVDLLIVPGGEEHAIR